ncbi:MAG: HU family DNA-binding protein [Spirochaetales bacterium]|nr:HU family DNA-binding protein [Spirochaetales bacterium]
MDERVKNLPGNIQTHLRSVTASSGLPDTDESYEKIALNWIEKKKMFEDQIKSLDMIAADSLDRDDEHAALLYTYSGSLITLGGNTGKGRWVEYASIKLRSDVPDVVAVPVTELSDNIRVDEEISFTGGPIKKTSALFRIAICREPLPIEEQEKRVREATIFLTSRFTKANRKVMAPEAGAPRHFTMKSIIRYLASKSNITQKQAAQIIEDYLYILESGMLIGERIPLGRIGKLSIRKRAAQKARVGMNPHTGKKITIPAKPEMYVPKMSFGKGLRERVSEITIHVPDLP